MSKGDGIDRGYCADCEYARHAMAHESRLRGLENREGAGVAEARATRDDMRELRVEIGGWIRSLTEHIGELRSEMRVATNRLDAIDETIAHLVEAVWAAQ